ncbi:hypothetical protein CkaCkLH20_11690 [Colletotrichum karsti]|uniref:Uncharacterized protein n=1 Tax=Colletotrichum karsti TaxID=1095194 RepID=A0A9P6HXE7_9PEZI|nr:uncharacterized protein CkaCkLH20_11690 [Colletotrichum karsti]KAF9870791.1 hypothetical protein CkaCkLH20_11690 [Colletotrichum karsti]
MPKVIVQIPYLTMTGDPYFGLYFCSMENLSLGDLTLDLSGGLGIRFDRNGAFNYNISIGTITITSASSQAIETWNIDGLTIGTVIAKDVSECGLLLQKVTNARIGLVNGDNVASGSGYTALRFANTKNNSILSRIAVTWPSCAASSGRWRERANRGSRRV